MSPAQGTESLQQQGLLELLRHSGCIYCLDLSHGTPKTGEPRTQNCPGSRYCKSWVMPSLVPWSCQLEPPRPKTATQTHTSPSSSVPLKQHRRGRAALADPELGSDGAARKDSPAWSLQLVQGPCTEMQRFGTEHFFVQAALSEKGTSSPWLCSCHQQLLLLPSAWSKDRDLEPLQRAAACRLGCLIVHID